MNEKQTYFSHRNAGASISVSRYSFTVPNSEPVTVTLQYELTDYNLEDASNLLPEITIE